MSCILWQGAVNSGGYPITWDKGKTTYAHRLAAEAPKGTVVRHTCDNPRCVNPEHLVIGTSQENSTDMVRKHRQAVGEMCGNAKLTPDIVLQIRCCQGTISSRKLAALTGISKTNILDIWNKKIWKHLP